jgi:hypothetical protein
MDSQIQLNENEYPISRAWTFFTILFLIVDYARPQDTIKFLGYLRPTMLISIILIFFLIRNFRLIDFKIPQTRLILCFIGVLAILIPFAVNRHWAYDVTQLMFLYMPFILSSIICFNTLDKIKKLLFWAVCLMVYQSQYALMHAGCGTGSIFLDENDLSLFINTWLPFSFAFFISYKGVWEKIFYGTCTLLGIAANVVSLSRGGFLGLIGMFAVFWLFSPKKLISLTAIAIVGLGLYVFAGDKYWKEMSTSTDSQDGTGKARIESWKSGWNMFLHNPLGVGGNNFGVRFEEFQSGWFQRGMWGRVSHSLWFTLLPETGVEGVLIYLALIFINVRDIFKIRKTASYLDKEDEKFFRNLSVSFLASLAGFFASATFLTVLYYQHYWYLSGIIASAYIVSQKAITIIPNEEIANVS